MESRDTENIICGSAGLTKYLNRQHALWKKFVSWLNNIVSSYLLNKPFNIYMSSYRAFVKSVANEIIKYKLEAIDSGLGDSNTYDSFELTIIPNSVEAPSLYSTFGENELITGELYLAEITIQRSER